MIQQQLRLKIRHLDKRDFEYWQDYYLLEFQTISNFVKSNSSDEFLVGLLNTFSNRCTAAYSTRLNATENINFRYH